ncbi:MAG: EamA family transporter [Candidatus Cryptobacteroides sp.]|nr:EamA family transporter [Candidatus Cryptobacteroides sp.]
MSERHKKLIVYIVSVVTIILWGMSYLWSDRLIALDIPVVYMVFCRSLIAGIFLFLLNLAIGNKLAIRKKDLPSFVLLAFCEPFIYFVCETYGIKYTESPTLSALMIATAPVFSVAAGVVFFKERINWVNIVGIVICIAGLSVVTRNSSCGGEHLRLGLLLLLIAVLAEVGYASATKLLAENYKPMVIVMYQFLAGAILLLPLVLTIGKDEFDPRLLLSAEVLKPMLCLAVLCSGIAFTLWASSIKNLGVGKASVFLAMIPVVTALLGFFMGREKLCPIQWTGIGVAFAGLILTQYVLKRNRGQED